MYLTCCCHGFIVTGSVVILTGVCEIGWLTWLVPGSSECEQQGPGSVSAGPRSILALFLCFNWVHNIALKWKSCLSGEAWPGIITLVYVRWMNMRWGTRGHIFSKYTISLKVSYFPVTFNHTSVQVHWQVEEHTNKSSCADCSQVLSPSTPLSSPPDINSEDVCFWLPFFLCFYALIENWEREERREQREEARITGNISLR